MSSLDGSSVGPVFSIAKLPEGQEHQNILINLTNSSPDAKKVEINLMDSIPELKGSPVDLNVEKVITPHGNQLDVKRSHPITRKENGNVQLALAPHQAVILNLKQANLHHKFMSQEEFSPRKSQDKHAGASSSNAHTLFVP